MKLWGDLINKTLFDSVFSNSGAVERWYAQWRLEQAALEGTWRNIKDGLATQEDTEIALRDLRQRLDRMEPMIQEVGKLMGALAGVFRED